MTDQPSLSELSDAATQGNWWVGHYANPEHPCNCRYLFGGDRMGSIATFDDPLEVDPESDNPPESEQIANGKLIAALVNAYRAGTLVDVSDLASLVKPLVWIEGGHDAFEQDADWIDTTQTYQIQEGVFWYAAEVHGVRCGTNRAAKAAAEAHHVAHTLSMLNLPAKEDTP